MLKYEIYDVTDDGPVLNRTVELETDDVDVVKQIKMLDKDKLFYVKPIGKDSIWTLKGQPKKGNAKLTPSQVIRVFEIKADKNESSQAIANQIYEELGIAMSNEAISNILKRKSYKKVQIPQELLDRIEINPKTKRQMRSTITPEDKEKMLELHKNGEGLSGRKISMMPEFPYSDQTINRMFQKELGFMYNGKRAGK